MVDRRELLKQIVTASAVSAAEAIFPGVLFRPLPKQTSPCRG